ncbi:MAG: hypothetical protein VR67_10300 [Peptococcaceae bacterium BRH_c8a]|nr:MAG: hypothetical protein VR67_10300 [Peptococcaceae bacterium BRH_c8a]
MRSSTRYPNDPFNIFLVLVLLILGTGFRGAGVVSFTNQPAQDPAPQPPALEPDVQEHHNDPQDDALEHSEIPQISSDGLEANQDEQESISPDSDDDAVTEKGETPASLIITDTTKENPPMTLPADKLIKEWRCWPEGKK